ncbi:MAG: RNase adapter RapZ [Ghiorsea sp.]|nr:RNase adapter RapZ [Ghiorsea sp.]MDQ7058144.1 RNase adapter RapZ [Ghiorsea sp.]
MLFIITGLSGAGKSTALHALEDLGLFCTDNLPVTMLAHWAENMMRNANDAAVGIDIRSTENPELLSQALVSIRQDLPWKIIFIDAENTVLQRRFSTLKRVHPYAPDIDLEQAILAERIALEPLHEQADIVMNSSLLTPYQLAQSVESFWQKQQDNLANAQPVTCSLVSFSYQKGLPPGADMVMDMRFLPNPHYEPALAPMTGKDKAVQDFFKPIPEVCLAEYKIKDWLTFIWPHLIQERKRYFTLAFGCSGGRHRSVYMTERIAAWMLEQGMSKPMVRHRELGDIQ